MSSDASSSTSSARPYRLANLHYALPLSRLSQSYNFSVPKPMKAPRDMEELMSRDCAFREDLGDGTPRDDAPLEEEEAMSPLIAFPPETMGNTSIYTKLYEEDQFRLLEILPGAEDTTVQCVLHTCFLHDNRNAYEALSYCWIAEWYSQDWSKGCSMQPSIVCNGVETVVGLSLHRALCRLRREDTSRVIWADAICINQDDPEERSQQVSAMGDIFRNAFRVLVWLGVDRDFSGTQTSDPHNGSASPAFSAVCSVVSTWAAREEPTVKIQNPHYRIQGLAEDFHGDGPLPPESKVWFKALGLYYRRWFKRLWVVQEIALARRATVIWGQCEISWQWIGLAAAILRTNWHRMVTNSSDRQMPVGVMNAYFMYRISQSRGYFEPLEFSFCELLTLTRQFECQEQQDKIFGLLGLKTTDGVNVLIKPDYTKSLEDVYRHVATVMASSPKGLAFLSHVHHTDIIDQSGGFDEKHFSEDHGSPPKVEPQTVIPSQGSWVPRWHIRGPQTLTPLDTNPDFAAGLSKPASIRMNSQSTSLTVQGIILENVRHKVWLGRTSFEPHGESPLRMRMPMSPWAPKKQEDFSQALTSILVRTRHTGSSLEKLALTLTAGKGWYGTPITDRAGVLADFAACLVTGQLFWALERDAFGHREETGNQINSENAPSADVSDLVMMPELEELAKTGNGDLFMDAVTAACVGRCLFSTDSGMSGVGPHGMRPEDTLCVIYGTAVPFIIRRCEDKQGYKLVGECYVHDIMHGEAAKDGRYQDSLIELA